MKKFKFLGLVAVTAVLLACNNGNNNDDEWVEGSQGSDLVTEENRGTPQILENIEAMQDEDALNEFVTIAGNKSGNGIILVDLFSNEVLKEVELLFEEEQVVHSTHEFPNGYYGAFAMMGADITRDEDGFIIGLGWGSEVRLTFFLFDPELNLVQEFEITDERITSVWGSVLTFIEGEVLIYHHDWMWGEGVYVYNVMTNSSNLIEIDLDEEIFIHFLHETSSPNQFAFSGHRLNDEIHTYYGVIDLQTGQVQYSRTDFSVGSMVVSGSYLLLTENPPPLFLGGVPESKVIVFNLITGEEHIVQLEGYESTNAVVIADRYVLTGSYEQIRVYDIQTSNLIFERPPSVEMLPQIDSVINEAGELVEGVYPHIRTFLTVHEGLYAILFDIGDGTPHVEFIVID